MTDDPRIPCEPAVLPAGSSARKTMLRRALLAARGALDPAVKAEWDGLIVARVVAWWRAHRAAALGVYWPLRGEPDLSAAYAELAELGVQLALPVVVARDAALGFSAWTPGEAMRKDSLGVAVPAVLRPMARPPALLVPCLGFNIQGYRLGYGGGFYDRTLEQAPRPLTLGIAYAMGAVVFDSDAHDVALDDIITEA